jgi:hypothetical protein
VCSSIVCEFERMMTTHGSMNVAENWSIGEIEVANANGGGDESLNVGRLAIVDASAYYVNADVVEDIHVSREFGHIHVVVVVVVVVAVVGDFAVATPNVFDEYCETADDDRNLIPMMTMDVAVRIVAETKTAQQRPAA